MLSVHAILGVFGIISLTNFAVPAAHADTLKPGFKEIIGGQDVSPDDLIAKTTVLIVGKEKGQTFLCSGSIIAPNLVLTAAHCLGARGDAQLVVVFSTSIHSQGKVVRVQSQIQNAGFHNLKRGQGSDWNDLGMLRLSENIPLGYTVAKLAGDSTFLHNGSSVTLAGYGINVPVPPTNQQDEAGAGVLRKIDQTVLQAHYGQTEFLVSLKNGGSCHGDSGGPAMAQSGSDHVLVGVASRLTGDDQVGQQGNEQDFSCTVDMIYTDVGAQMNWIQRAAAQL